MAELTNALSLRGQPPLLPLDRTTFLSLQALSQDPVCNLSRKIIGVTSITNSQLFLDTLSSAFGQAVHRTAVIYSQHLVWCGEDCHTSYWFVCRGP